MTSIEDRKMELEVRELEHKVWRMDRERERFELQVEAGEFQLIGPITERTVHKLIGDLEAFSREYPNRPITLTINSQGGVVVDGYALYDFLQRLKQRGHHLTTVVLGLVASMGGLLLQAGNERVMTPRTWMMVHEVQGLVEGSYSDMKNVLGFNKRLQDQALEILAERAKLSKPTLKKKWKDDWWLSAEDALKAGFIDRVGE